MELEGGPPNQVAIRVRRWAMGIRERAVGSLLRIVYKDYLPF